ncbi:MAG: N-acetyl-gamma-glutamyl-phosphate reductase, partial [Alphaproteobacteria bacterium]
ASGYTGADMIRLALGHPLLEIAALTGERKVGQRPGEIWPHLAMIPGLPVLAAVEDVDWSGLDVVFCCLPHGTSQQVIKGIVAGRGPKVIDLSADFRLRDPDVYAQWYGHAHAAPELQGDAVYGLTEFYRADIACAQLVACPGCYPTAALLALLPLLADGLIGSADIIIDAKSGVSGAGRGLKEQNLFAEVAEAMHPYGIGRHRHMPEIEQELSRVAGCAVTVSFTPHLVPMNRGELETIYVSLQGGASVEDAKAALAARYRDEPFVHVLDSAGVPATRMVRGSNHCVLNVFADRIAGRAILVAAIDNLVKGSSGQALQNMNRMLGLDETLGLGQVALFP